MGDGTIRIGGGWRKLWPLYSCRNVCECNQPQERSTQVSVKKDSDEEALGDHSHCARATHKTLGLNVLGACRQIYFEASTIPFTKNVFTIGRMQIAGKFLESLKEPQRKAIRHLHLTLDFHDRVDGRLRRMLVSLTGLRHLRLVFTQTLWQPTPQESIPLLSEDRNRCFARFAVEVFASLSLETVETSLNVL